MRHLLESGLSGGGCVRVKGPTSGQRTFRNYWDHLTDKAERNVVVSSTNSEGVKLGFRLGLYYCITLQTAAWSWVQHGTHLHFPSAKWDCIYVIYEDCKINKPWFNTHVVYLLMSMLREQASQTHSSGKLLAKKVLWFLGFLVFFYYASLLVVFLVISSIVCITSLNKHIWPQLSYLITKYIFLSMQIAALSTLPVYYFPHMLAE